MPDVTIREVPIEQAVAIANMVTDFGETYTKEHFEDRYQDKAHLIIVGLVDNQPAGFIVAYDRDQDGSLYCWMAGVDPNFRRRGALTALMDYQDSWAKEHGYTKIKIKTRNNRREMLANLVKRGFMFTAVEPYPEVGDNRISLERPL
jgi:ribosomal protein S18 acetylase RimI-like enzyme